MEQNIKRFTINSKILSNSYKKSFVLKESGQIWLPCDSGSGMFITGKLDSSEKGMKWGRIVINGELPEDCEYYIYLMASDDFEMEYKNEIITYDNFFKSSDIPLEDKIFMLSSEKSKVEKNKKDILLFGLEGRYLWVAIEIIHTSKEVCIENVLVYFPGDSLIKYLPEIYKKNEDDFFKRYLAIFSSMNKDYQREVDYAASLIDVDTAPDRVVPLLSKWLGMDIKGNFLSIEQLRILIKNARYLNQYKGTIEVISKVVELFIGTKPIIVEQIKVEKYTSVENFNLYQELYGKKPCEFLIMLNQDLTEEVFYQLRSLINIFKPARTKVTIIFLNQEVQIDRYCYIDINARITKSSEGMLCENQYLDTNVILAK